MRIRLVLVPSLLTMAAALPAQNAPAVLEMRSVGPIAFAPDHQLLVSDPAAATVYAFDVRAASAQGLGQGMRIESLDAELATALATEGDEVRIMDFAVNPADGQAWFSVMRGHGPDAEPAVLRRGAEGPCELVFLEELDFSRAELPSPPVAGEGRRARNRHLESITDMAFLDGQVVIAGLSNEEFSSRLRTLQFPFQEGALGASIEIYHGAHGKHETHAPVRTFVPYQLEGDPYILAAYTCTPLVLIPTAALQPGAHVKGRTVAELGNRNRPLDMVLYEQGDEEFVLMANSSRGVMKIPTAGLADAAHIEERIEDKAGIAYETVEALQGVVHLDKLDAGHAVVLIRDGERHRLEVIPLP